MTEAEQTMLAKQYEREAMWLLQDCKRIKAKISKNLIRYDILREARDVLNEVLEER